MMKTIRLSLILSAIAVISLYLGSCNDSGVVTTKNKSEFTVSHFPRLDQNIDGLYEAWVSIETSADHGDDAFRSLGRFNIAIDGSIVDKDGNPFTLNISKIPNINDVGDAIITVEPPYDNDTVIGFSSARMIGGAKVNQSGKLYFNLTMDYDEILGSAAANIPGATAKYVLAAPTTNDTLQYKRGAWFSLNTIGNSAGLTLSTIHDTLDWMYQAWIIDTSIDTVNRQYNMGRFSSSVLPDDYYSCQVSFTGQWNLPGQEWTLPNCPGGGRPDITDLTTGNYKMYVTLEPRRESGTNLNWPFKIVIFYGSIPQGVNYGTVLTLQNVAVLPAAQIILSTE